MNPLLLLCDLPSQVDMAHPGLLVF